MPDHIFTSTREKKAFESQLKQIIIMAEYERCNRGSKWLHDLNKFVRLGELEWAAFLKNVGTCFIAEKLVCLEGFYLDMDSY